MTSQAVMKRYLTAVSKTEEYANNKIIQNLAIGIANFKKLAKKDQEELNVLIEGAYNKLQAKGFSVKKTPTKTTTTRKTRTTEKGGLKAILADLKKKLGAEKFKEATTGTDIQKDIQIPALKKGKRIVRKKGYTTNQYGTFKNQVGTAYWESRANRFDANQPSQTRKYKLADGGEVTIPIQVIVDGNWDEPKFFKTISLAKKYIVENTKNHDFELVDSYGDSIFIEKGSSKADFDFLFSDLSYAKGGKLNDNLYFDQLAGMSGTRAVAVKEWATANDLSKDDLLNIIQGLGRKQITSSDFVSAVLGDKSATSEIVSYAKSGKGFKMAKGGKLKSRANYIPKRDIQEIEVERKGKTTFVDGADMLDGVYVKKGVKFAKGGKISPINDYIHIQDLLKILIESKNTLVNEVLSSDYDTPSKRVAKVQINRYFDLILSNLVENNENAESTNGNKGYSFGDEPYSYINNFGVNQEDFIKLVDVYHSTNPLNQMDRIVERLTYKEFETKYGEETFNAVMDYIQKIHDYHNKYAKGGTTKRIKRRSC
jgi:hypothetical protein